MFPLSTARHPYRFEYLGVYDRNELITLRRLFRRISEHHAIKPDSEKGQMLGRRLLRIYGYGVRDTELLKQFVKEGRRH